jgi:hypothetical protein
MSFGKPRTFSGLETDWSDWAFSFIAFCNLLDGRIVPAMCLAEQGAFPVAMPTAEDEVKLSSSLYFMLAMVCTGSTLTELRSLVDSSGLEGWRRLSQRFEPRTRNRQLSLLDQCLRPHLQGDGAVVRNRIIEWEAIIAKRESLSGSPLTDDIRIATLLRSVSDVHQQYLTQLIGQSGSGKVAYSALRESFVAFLGSRRLDDAMACSAVKGKGTSKDRKGKGASKGKD